MLYNKTDVNLGLYIYFENTYGYNEILAIPASPNVSNTYRFSIKPLGLLVPTIYIPDT